MHVFTESAKSQVITAELVQDLIFGNFAFFVPNNQQMNLIYGWLGTVEFERF